MRGVMEKRYPGLQFLIQVSEKANPEEFLKYGSDVGAQVSHKLEGIDTIFVYGVGLGHYYDALRPWLEESPVRELIFIEDEMAMIEGLEREGRFDQIFSHPKVHLLPVMPGADIDELCMEAARAFVSNKIEVMAIRSYKEAKGKRFEKMREGLLRASTLIDAMQKESLFHHQLFKNLIQNYPRIPGSFFVNGLKGRFKGVPAVICGAGPSLKESIPALKKLENRALIFAGGSTVSALTNLGVQPHFAAAVDPNPSEWSCLKRNKLQDVPFVFASRVLPKIFTSFNGPLGYVQTFTGGPSEQLMEERLGLTGHPLEEAVDSNGMSVTTLAVSMAVAMGCDPIVMTGVDMAYTNKKRYAAGVDEPERDTSLRSDEQVFYRKGVKGEKVETLTKWLMESDWVSEKAKREEARFINATNDGLGFEGIPNQDLDEVAKHYMRSEYPLRDWVHAEIASVKISEEKQADVEKVLDELYASLERMDALLGDICLNLEKEKRLDHPSLILHEMDLREEFAFEKLMVNILKPLLATVMKTMERLPFDASAKEEKKYHLTLAYKKYRFMQKIVMEYIKIFKLERVKIGK